MLAALEKVNKIKNMDNVVARSSDVIKLYPSLKAAEVGKLISKAFINSSLEVEVDDLALGLYLALVKKGLSRVTDTWKEGHLLQGSQQPRCLARSRNRGRKKERKEKSLKSTKMINPCLTLQRPPQAACRGRRWHVWLWK